MDMTTNAINKIQEMAVEAAGKKINENNGEFYKVDGEIGRASGRERV